MKKLIILVLSGFILTACGGVVKLEVSELKSVFIEYNHADNINFGSEIEAKVLAIMNGGKQIDITNNRKLDLVSTDIDQKGNSKSFKIIKHPTDFNDDFAAVKLTVSDKEETFEALDTIHMNFRGDLFVRAGGLSGSDGEDQKNRGTRLIGRDGKDGDDGTFGQNGSPSSNFVAQIWQEGEMVYIYLRNTVNNQEWKYRTLIEGTIEFDLTGGNGGDGGDGGEGGDGKDGTISDDKSRNPGDGGHGGHGGDGGTGGNGGSIQVFLHPNATAVQTKLVFQTLGGNGGKAGSGGDAGKPGDALAGQTFGASGSNGRSGRSGADGLNGTSELTVIEFDVEQYK